MSTLDQAVEKAKVVTGMVTQFKVQSDAAKRCQSALNACKKFHKNVAAANSKKMRASQGKASKKGKTEKNSICMRSEHTVREMVNTSPDKAFNAGLYASLMKPGTAVIIEDDKIKAWAASMKASDYWRKQRDWVVKPCKEHDLDCAVASVMKPAVSATLTSKRNELALAETGLAATFVGTEKQWGQEVFEFQFGEYNSQSDGQHGFRHAKEVARHVRAVWSLLGGRWWAV